MPRASEPIKMIETPAGKRYVAVADAPRTQGDKRRQVRRRFRRRGDAVTWLGQMRAGTAEELQEQVSAQPASTRFQEGAKPWLEVKRKTVRTNTFLGYEGAVKTWSEHFGEIPSRRSRKSRSRNSSLAIRMRGSRCAGSPSCSWSRERSLEEAIEENLATRNPAKRVKPRGKASVERRAMSGTEYERLQAAIAGNEYEALWLLSLAGLRRSEVLGLKWSDLDLEERTLTVKRGRVEIGNRGKELTGSDSSTEVGEPKTSNGYRTLPLPSPILEALKRLRAVQMRDLGLGQVRDSFVAVNAAGQPLRPEVYSDEWRQLLSGAEIGNYTLHEARHTSVTRAREAGVPDHAVAEWHGHDENVMRQTYSHPSQESQREAASALFGS